MGPSTLFVHTYLQRMESSMGPPHLSAERIHLGAAREGEGEG